MPSRIVSAAINTCFVDKKRKRDIPIQFVREADAKGFIAKLPAAIRTLALEADITGKKGQSINMRNTKGQIEKIVFFITTPTSVYDSAPLIALVRQLFSKEILKNCSFSVLGNGLKADTLEAIALGWALGCYYFGEFKTAPITPLLLWPGKVNKERIQNLAEAICMTRALVNIPANHLGPVELENFCHHFAARHKAKISVTKDSALEKGFPLIHMVGSSSPRPPRLIDIRWGKKGHKKLTLVGKGVCFDTGGLNLKPGTAMATMKKDMGGAAHVLGLAHLIITLKLPIALRVLIPAVENSVSGTSFRPGDVVRSRKGITVENTNTDAEGRLILADTLFYACEDKPGLIIDFATLTGSARAALGPDIPALLSTNQKLADMVRDIGLKNDDPVWPLPLWAPYRKVNDSSIADCINSTGTPGDTIYSALFMQQFITPGIDWMHIDCFAWENGGRPGRPRGGCDTGLRTLFTFIEQVYA